MLDLRIDNINLLCIQLVRCKGPRPLAVVVENFADYARYSPLAFLPFSRVGKKGRVFCRENTSGFERQYGPQLTRVVPQSSLLSKAYLAEICGTVFLTKITSGFKR